MDQMRIEYVCVDGRRAVSSYPSFALLQWMSQYRPHQYPKDLEPLKVYIVGAPIPNDCSDVFMPLLYSTVEREYNLSPPFEIIKPTDELRGGSEYQRMCLLILRWFEEKRLVSDLRIEPDRDETVEDVKRIL